MNRIKTNLLQQDKLTARPKVPFKNTLRSYDKIKPLLQLVVNRFSCDYFAYPTPTEGVQDVDAGIKL